MGWKEGGCEDWLFFYTLVFVVNAALIMMLMVVFFCFFVDLISEGTFSHILEFQTFLELLQSC